MTDSPFSNPFGPVFTKNVVDFKPQTRIRQWLSDIATANYGAASPKNLDPFMLGVRNHAPTGSAPPLPQIGTGMANTRAYVEPDYNGVLRRRMGAPAQHWQGAYGIPAESYMPRQAAPPPQAMLGSTADATSRLKGRIRASGVGNNLTDEQLVQMGVLSPQFLQNSQRPVQRQPVTPAPSTQIGSMAPVRAGWRDNANLDMRTMDRGLAGQGTAPAYGPNGQVAAFLPKVGTNYADLPQSKIEFGSAADQGMSQARLEYLRSARAQMQPGTTKTVNLGEYSQSVAGLSGDNRPAGTRFTSYSYGPGGQVIEHVRQGVPSQNVQLHSYTPEQRAQLEMNAMAHREMQQQKREGIRANITQLAQAKAAARGQRMAARAMGPDPVAMAAMQGNPAALAIMQMQGQMGLANARMQEGARQFDANLAQQGNQFGAQFGLDQQRVRQQGEQFGLDLASRERIAKDQGQNQLAAAELTAPTQADMELRRAQAAQAQAEADLIRSQLPGAPGGALNPQQTQQAQQIAGQFSALDPAAKLQHAEQTAAGIVATARSRQEAEQMLKAAGLTVADLEALPRYKSNALGTFMGMFGGLGAGAINPQMYGAPTELQKTDALLNMLGRPRKTPWWQ